MRVTLLSFCLLLLSSCSVSPKTAQAPELHLVSIYEAHDPVRHGYLACENDCIRAPETKGNVKACEIKCKEKFPTFSYRQRAPAPVPVAIDRPGKNVDLILGGHDPTHWKVQVTEKTQLQRILLIGSGRKQMTVEVNGALFEPVITEQMTAPSARQGPNFREVVEDLSKQYGYNGLTSAHVSYRSKPDGFVVESVDNSRDLHPRHLDINIDKTTLKTAPKMVAMVGNQKGVFRADGNLLEAKEVLPHNFRAIDTQNKISYQWLREYFVVTRTSDGKRLDNLPGAQLNGKNLRFLAITYDKQNHRLIGGFGPHTRQSVINYYDLDAKTGWLPFAALPKNLTIHSLMASPERDSLFVIAVETWGRARIYIMEITAKKELKTIEVDWKDLPGMSDVRTRNIAGTPDMELLGIDVDELIFGTTGTNMVFDSSRETQAQRRVYLLNLETEEFRLTYYD